MADRLSPLDATFLELEEADESAHMHIGAVLVFEALPDGGVPSVEELRERLDERLDALPRYRQRLSTPRTGGLRWPSWEDDPHFDVAGHVRRARLPDPGDDEQLTDWAADFWSHRLDRGRPLWEMVLLEGLADGRWALATKTHHCLVDGVGSVDVAHVLLDVEPIPAAPAVPPAVEPVDGARGAPLLGLLTAVPRAALTALRSSAEAARHPTRTAEAAAAAVELLVRDELVPAPRTSLNVPITGSRRYRAVRTDLATVKAVAHSLGGTVNDVVLAAVAGGLRRQLVERGERPPRTLRAMVPVNVRTAGERMALGNRITSLFVELPVGERDPVRAFRATHRSAQTLKSGRQGAGARAVVDLAGLAPPVLHVALARALFATRLFNVTVTNVPGPQVPLYAFGARMSEVLPLVPLAAEHAVGVAVVSYDGGLCFGLVGDLDEAADLETAAAGIRDTLAALGRAAGVAVGDMAHPVAGYA